MAQHARHPQQPRLLEVRREELEPHGQRRVARLACSPFDQRRSNAPALQHSSELPGLLLPAPAPPPPSLLSPRAQQHIAVFQPGHLGFPPGHLLACGTAARLPGRRSPGGRRSSPWWQSARAARASRYPQPRAPRPRWPARSSGQTTTWQTPAAPPKGVWARRGPCMCQGLLTPPPPRARLQPQRPGARGERVLRARSAPARAAGTGAEGQADRR